MSNRLLLSALAAASLLGAAAPALAQGRVYDRNASNNPEIYQQTHPEDRSNPQLQGPPARGVEPPAQAPREAGRGNDRRDPGRGNARREPDRRQGDRRDWDRRGNDRRDYGYVVPRPDFFYYGAPPVYYPPPVYYGGVPQTYYHPYASSAPVFRTGDYLPPEYLGSQSLVLDWQWRGLSAPPWGYQWVLLGPDSYALVAMNTGQIVSLVVTR